MNPRDEEVLDSPKGWVGRHVLASSGGSRSYPSWYLNLSANPEVHVQVGADRFAARAVTAPPEDRPRLWQLMTSIWPEYDRYQTRTSREIPVVVIERKG
jgi:deazaflavin-dependent oxidoreductase (nitroreductase family)